ncbi:MAG: hypothetical protein CM15mP65_18220 [Crocinitomicaceae bacterium]|nr:MAG: hypothetical protein CM15mP65_18220 [Crocinitomicaceae bacterium]
MDLKININNEIYCYWFDDWATILSILKLKKLIPNFVQEHMVSIYMITETIQEKLSLENFNWEKVKNFLQFQRMDNLPQTNISKYSDKVMQNYLGTKNFGLSVFKPSKTLKI